MNPILVEVQRGGEVESYHRGRVIVYHTSGDILLHGGDVDRLIYPRSALKLFQAIPLIESGAAANYKLTTREIALACGSHGGEPMHLKVVNNWLNRIGFTVNDLACGPAKPMNSQALKEFISAGKKPTRAHHNCSGKHAAMLTSAKFHNDPLPGYHNYQHRTQVAWRDCLAELTECDIATMPWEQDGCGLPAICIPLKLLARGFANYATPDNIGGARGAAMREITYALQTESLMIAGHNRCCSAVIQTGCSVVKYGAEGVYGGFIPGRGIGFALKIDDGARRAAEVALGALLTKLRVLSPDMQNKLANYFAPLITNSIGHITGRIAPAKWWKSFDIKN